MFDESKFLADLDRFQCKESVDLVSGDKLTTHFKQMARLHQSKWREERGLPIGTQPMRPRDGAPIRNLGSRLDLEFSRAHWSNFLGASIRDAVEARISKSELHQTLNEDRLFCDLLSSMPMCFNLFGWLHGDPVATTNALRVLAPDAPGHVAALRFEWSPGRREKTYLGNRSAFDVALELELGAERLGIVGIETKYHEHCKAERRPTKERLDRYVSLTMDSGIFRANAIDTLIGKDLQQIWLDHLLVLAMLQHPSQTWNWGRFLLVYPARNRSYSHAVERYRSTLSDSETFGSATIESLLSQGLLPTQATSTFRERYLW